MSYGRISWRDLVYTMQNEVTRRYWQQFIRWPPNKDPQSTRPLIEIIKRNRIARLSSSDPQWLPELFELCEQLDEALRTHPSQTGGPETLRHLAMKLVHDQHGHAWQILYDALADRPGPFPKRGSPYEHLSEVGHAQLRERAEAFDTYHSAIERHLRSPAFNRRRSEARGNGPRLRPARLDKACPGQQNARTNSSCTSSPLGRLTSSSTRQPLHSLPAPLRTGLSRCGAPPSLSWALLGRYHKHLAQSNPDALLPPTHRSIIGALLRLAEATIRPQLLNHISGLQAAPQDALGRYAPERDPLNLLLQRLGIRRFLTTNYDHEIERTLERNGFRPAKDMADLPHDGAAAQSLDPTSPACRDFVFSDQRTGELVAVGAQDRHRSAAVVHLHGRTDAIADVIVSERDYQWRYVRADESRAMIDDAIGLAFAANPILFVGSGMGEDDILRQLRQFMSTPGRGGERVCVALLPNDRSQEEIHQFKDLSAAAVRRICSPFRRGLAAAHGRAAAAQGYFLVASRLGGQTRH